MTTPTTHLTLRQFLLHEQERDPALPNIAALMEDIAQATRRISYLVSRGALGGALGSAGTDNVQGEVQKKLDVISNDIMLESLEWSGHWAGVGSEELEDPIVIPSRYQKGRYLCLFDPLDGSSNIDINGSIGTIFSILRCPDGVSEPRLQDYLQAGSAQLAAGFTLYGPATVLVLTIGNGVQGFTLERGSGEYLLTHPEMRIPEETREVYVNMSNHRYWSAPMQRYIDECIKGTESARGVHFNSRWAASMVGDVYRVLCNGGIFMYPWDSKDPDKPGKLRLMYEANPMGWIVEQAGGLASTAYERILDIKPEHLHQRCPVVLGARSEVERVIQYHHEGL